MEMFRVGSFCKTVEAVDVSRSNDKSVWIGARRRARSSYYEIYFDTYQDARDYLINKAEKRLERAVEEMAYAEEFLYLAKSLSDTK